ncbi:MAG TPA: glutamate cyclase domain-containing protein, partial [Desulfobacterales bacterium]|nr:glutamate cyclase domain-containing protein [Desulfobacterales bacterium]
MNTSADPIEDIILSHGTRGMERIRGALSPGYCARAARLLLAGRGRVLIGTGFPVGDSFETDGPIGAIALYRVLEGLGHEPVFGCAPPISQVLARDYRT